MTILFVGGEDSDFASTTGGFAAAQGDYEAAYSRKGLQTVGRAIASVFMTMPDDITPASELWLHFNGRMATLSNFDSEVELFSLTNPTLGLVCGVRGFAFGSTARFFWHDGISTVTIDSETFDFTRDVNSKDYDFHAKVEGTSLTLEFYTNGTLTKTKTFTLNVGYQFTNFKLFNGSNFADSWGFNWSQILLMTTTSIGHKVFTRQPSAAGNYTQFEGSYLDVNEREAVGSTMATKVAARQSFARDTLAVPAGKEVKAIAVNSMTRKGQVALTKARHFLRIGGTDYESADINLNVGYKTISTIWETNPATGVKFTNAEANASLEFGVRALA